MVAMLLVLTIPLTGCHYCVKRDVSTENLDEYAEKYGLLQYEVMDVSFHSIEDTVEYYHGDRVGITPEQNHKMLVDRQGNSLSIVFVSACSDDDLYFIEDEFPSQEIIDSKVEEYNLTAKNLLIQESFESSPGDMYYFVSYANDENMDSNIIIVVGYLDYGDSYDVVGLISVGDGKFAFVTSYVLIYEEDEMETIFEFEIQ